MDTALLQCPYVNISCQPIAFLLCARLLNFCFFKVEMTSKASGDSGANFSNGFRLISITFSFGVSSMLTGFT